jgi:hypothetical protein
MRRPLAKLLDMIDRPAAVAFVEAQVGELPAYDRKHGTNLAGVLEAALDVLAASPHPPTQLRSDSVSRALDLVGADIGDPDMRLALHVALKLRKRI